MRVGVVIVTYNSEAHIGACLDSLGPAAPGLDLQVGVVDNASSDGTLDVVRKSMRQCRVVSRSRNDGFAVAENEGVALLPDCDALLLLNPDARMTPDSLATLARTLESRSGVAAVGPRLPAMSGRRRRSPGCDSCSAR